MWTTIRNVLLSTLIMVFAGAAVFFGFTAVKVSKFNKKKRVVVEEYGKTVYKYHELGDQIKHWDSKTERLFAAADTKLSFVVNLLEEAEKEMDLDILEAAKNNLQIANEILKKLEEKLSQTKNVRQSTDIFISISSSDIPANPTFPTPEGVSIIRAKRFHFRVRNGNGWFTLS